MHHLHRARALDAALGLAICTLFRESANVSKHVSSLVMTPLPTDKAGSCISMSPSIPINSCGGPITALQLYLVKVLDSVSSAPGFARLDDFSESGIIDSFVGGAIVSLRWESVSWFYDLSGDFSLRLALRSFYDAA
ncbi:uncharacterized protein FOMMEDRAFT_152493 [Fomitiporia mediterranea MF3/22]|uniref:uncharacterized protein n=1 Tax=Fomitiporia mediterranea (strain MF3/22) TaxID=694068 RepID=UPI000440799D|nr:uncharacterized protein FOMMEDRAFT_152493 [Fomitiporia mediterranea MF3/22]EJD07136.1 hypothetical protein FOMMEDRAFT_152493 [Fomitiporia mediterranea MF3/22]